VNIPLMSFLRKRYDDARTGHVAPVEEMVFMRTTTSIVPIILAAGDSSRMGYPKALLPLGGELFLTRILRLLGEAGLPRPVVVLGNAAPLIQPCIGDWPADIRINPDPRRGQLSSIQLGMERAGPECDGAMIWPVDQPAVSADLVRGLLELYVSSDARIVLPACNGRRGHPALFHRELFREFMEAPLEQGPKGILVRHRQETMELATEESATVRDIDTPADYLELTGQSLESALAQAKA